MNIPPVHSLESTIALWHIQLADDIPTGESYLPLLSTEEFAHAQTLSNPLLNSRYSQVRGHLRSVLAGILQQTPAHIRIARTEQGKPYLTDFPELVFNISHTANQLVIALARDCQLGIDIELCRPRASFSPLVTKCFADEEASYWHSLSETEKMAAFYGFWTKKEAFVKATGRGIALGLNQCVVNPQQPGQFLRLPAAYGDVGSWRILDLGELFPNSLLCGAIVVDKPQLALRLMT